MALNPEACTTANERGLLFVSVDRLGRPAWRNGSDHDQAAPFARLDHQGFGRAERHLGQRLDVGSVRDHDQGAGPGALADAQLDRLGPLSGGLRGHAGNEAQGFPRRGAAEGEPSGLEGPAIGARQHGGDGNAATAKGLSDQSRFLPPLF